MIRFGLSTRYERLYDFRALEVSISYRGGEPLPDGAQPIRSSVK